MPEIRLITLDPGHFHAALVQKEMYAGVARRAHVYAPLGADLAEHLLRIARFNTRSDQPTAWELEIHATSDFFERLLVERPGNLVVLSGRNRLKIRYIQAVVEAGLHVLADKPWIIEAEDVSRLQSALDAAESRGVIAYDIMTERYEITSILQRELVRDPEIFGTPQSVEMESVHHLFKLVAGEPLRRPAWFFDIREQGEALADVGTHLVDLVQWTLFPARAIRCPAEIRLLSAKRWPTVLTRDQFRRITDQPLAAERLDYFCNTRLSYELRGVPVKLDVLWNYEAPPGAGDTHFAVYRGSKARVEVRQGRDENYRPELFVVPKVPALAGRIAALEKQYPGIGLEDRGDEAHIHIPDRYRVGHEAHFAQVTRQFLEYLEHPERLPAWEKPNMLAKYFVTTKGVELSRSAA